MTQTRVPRICGRSAAQTDLLMAALNSKMKRRPRVPFFLRKTVRYAPIGNRVLLSVAKCDFNCQPRPQLNPPKLISARSRRTGTQTGTHWRPNFASGDNRNSVLR